MLGIVIIIAFWIKFGGFWGLMALIGFLLDIVINIVEKKA